MLVTHPCHVRHLSLGQRSVCRPVNGPYVKSPTASINFVTWPEAGRVFFFFLLFSSRGSGRRDGGRCSVPDPLFQRAHAPLDDACLPSPTTGLDHTSASSCSTPCFHLCVSRPSEGRNRTPATAISA